MISGKPAASRRTLQKFASIALLVVACAPISTPGGTRGPAEDGVAVRATPSGWPTAASTQPGSSVEATPPVTPSPSAIAVPPVAPTATTAGPTSNPTVTPTVKPKPSATPIPPIAPPTVGPPPSVSACPVLPASNVWNRRVDGLPVAANSDTLVAAIGLTAGLHPDFSNAGGYGIPYNIVGTSTPRTAVSFDYADESDPGPYPIPPAAKIEGGSDRHLLLIDTNACVLYELFAAVMGTGGWTAGSGAIWNLSSNDLRPAGWTSADAAGLPIFPGLVRYTEVASGSIPHAIRFTAPTTCDGYVYPARHEAGSGSCSSWPPMGLRVRLKASVDISSFGSQSRVILTALRQYGMLLADNGSPWYITGAPDNRWDDDELHDLGLLKGSDFEVVDTTGFVNG